MMNKPYRYEIETSNINYFCQIEVINPYICTNKDECEGSLNLIYRQISLNNPFPNTKNDGSAYRKMGMNWDPLLAEQYIKNNRGVTDEQVYNLEPLYTITLTPNLIDDIRKQFKNKSLSDFELECDAQGWNCESKFLHEYLYNKGAIIFSE